MRYDLDDIIYKYERSIKWLEEHKEDAGIKYTTIEKHAATLNYLKELKELKEKLDKPTGQVIDAIHYRKIKKIEFNGPATIIFWDDNTKTVVKNTVPSEYDREKAILYAAVKKLATKKEYNDILRTIDKGRTNDEWI